MMVTLCFCLRQARLRGWLWLHTHARARLLLPLLKNENGNEQRKWLLCGPASVWKAHLYVSLLRFDWRSKLWAGGSGMHRVPSLCSSSPPAARDTFRLEIFSLMAFAISSILRNTHKTNGVSSMSLLREGGRERRIGAPGYEDRSPK